MSLVYVEETVLKRDIFSETSIGHVAGDPATRMVLRRLDRLAIPGRWIGRALAAREARALNAVKGIDGVPQIARFDATGLLRGFVDGTPLNIAMPAEAGFYQDAKRLLRQMRRRGVTHNDLAKPQNWLMRPDGGAAVIDFQLAARWRRPGRVFRVQGYEDLRHLLKQKRLYAPGLMTPSEWRMVRRRALPSRLWMATAKPLYNFITRRLMHWSDSEGAGERLTTQGPAIEADLLAHPGIRAVRLCTYPRSVAGQGLYGFVETDLDAGALRRLMPTARIELLQPVPALPRDADGTVRDELLTLVAGNRLDELGALLTRDIKTASAMAPIIAGRLNLTDRV